MTTASDRPAWFLLTQHWLSLLGAALLATAVISWLFVLPLQIRGHAPNPYIGIIVFLILPAVFFLGLALIPLGIYLGKREIREKLTEPAFDRKSALRRLAWFFGIVTLLNVVIGTQLTYRAVEHMETPQFCGASCHVMNPELAAYQNSPHSRVECVECHVAPGAAGWISSKKSGTRQLIETTLGTAPKPIPSALETNRLVPPRETCENCHWPQMFGGSRLRVLSKYAEDEASTRSETVLMMLVGGNRVSGIHGAHLDPDIHIRYAAADPKRQTIPLIEYRNAKTGEVRTFVSPDSSHDSANKLPTFEMSCVDCHNRPTHTFDLPERAMDKRMALGDIPVTLPFIKKQGVELLKANYATHAEAAEKLPASLAAFYQHNYPDLYSKRQEDIQKAGQAILDIYQRNVFPDLKVTWGTYPNNLGHTDFPGCFRCHDGAHVAGDGKTISQDCNGCHQPLAIEETSPEILKTLGIAERISEIQKQYHQTIASRTNQHFACLNERRLLMNCRLTIGLALMLLLASPFSLAAGDGASVYKSKCAGCHGAKGEGKASIKAPALKGTTLEADQIVQHLTKGEASSKAPHNKGIAGLTDDQAKAIADYVKSLK